jgi:hypothetical protein
MLSCRAKADLKGSSPCTLSPFRLGDSSNRLNRIIPPLHVRAWCEPSVIAAATPLPAAVGLRETTRVLVCLLLGSVEACREQWTVSWSLSPGLRCCLRGLFIALPDFPPYRNGIRRFPRGPGPFPRRAISEAAHLKGPGVNPARRTAGRGRRGAHTST